ncbi:Mediator of RNA polymerase II transcription subunit 19 [Paragonimus heterotremus]|uniref:Mediator of RNA polymerase II transcription subunit 19 n=1 Tax=Paragonimus heterotremus TaxID=100268 RepID=A0A8J4SEQ2_9TREM|nr:Mediator of RNA polymerase II transcription subunit 19 [Paragonimus heterotremus]
MNSSPRSSASTLVNPTGATTQPNSTGSSMWINKLKIVGSGQNWAVAPCEPFYLMGTEPPAPDAALTGAKNLIEHYGLGNAYQKFCSKPLREELSAFLPHLSGNVDVPASADGSGLMVSGKFSLELPRSCFNGLESSFH